MSGRIDKSALLPTKHPLLFNIAWAAGVYEGEGHVSKSKYSITANATQKDPWLILQLRELFGGSVNHYHNGRTLYYRWTISGARARGFLYTIYSFLSPRRKNQIRDVMGNYLS